MGQGTRVFDTQTAEALGELDGVYQPCRVAVGELLFAQGDPADGAWLIDAGAVDLFMEIPGRGETRIASVGPGGLLGEPALMRRASRSLSARASDDVEARFIDRRDFQGLLHGLRPGSFRLLQRVALSTAGYVADALARTRGDDGVSPPCARAPEPETRPCSFDPRPFLPALPFFAEMSARDAGALLERGAVYEVDRGQTLIEAGCPPDSVWVVLRGAVEVLPPGSATRTSLLGPGQAVGVHPLLLEEPAPAGVRVREDAALVHYTGAALSELMAGGSRESFKFVQALARDLLRSLDRAHRGLARATLTRSLRPPPAEPG